MIGLVVLVQNDYILAVLCLIVSIASFKIIKGTKNEITIFLIGFFMMIAAEYIFISTGVETFVRRSLFGVMPIWLPVLWGYGFIATGRAIKIIEERV